MIIIAGLVALCVMNAFACWKMWPRSVCILNGSASICCGVVASLRALMGVY